MLYWLLVPLIVHYHALNVFRYITTRTICATLTSLCISFIIGKPIIKWLISKQKNGQPIRPNGPQSHLLSKVGTPTMGGLLILLTILLSILIWGNLCNPYVWIAIFSLISFGILGGIDDYLKLCNNNSVGLASKYKFIIQIIIAVLISLAVAYLSSKNAKYNLSIPFCKTFIPNLGYFLILFTTLVIVGSSNAVNLTDGLDGLAIIPVMLCALCFCVIAYLVGHIEFAKYLKIFYIANAGELAVVCGAIIGASLGFLWFNAPPAMVFMGDIGSLSLGGTIGTIAVISKHELVLFIIGGLFVLETLSVIFQVGYYKLTGKKIFLMAPIHHHFEKKGWAESTIVIRFWIIAIVLSLIGMATLKFR